MPKISALPIANSATTGDLLVLDQGNVTKRIDFNVLQSAFANAGTVQSLINQSLSSGLAGGSPTFSRLTVTGPAILGSGLTVAGGISAQKIGIGIPGTTDPQDQIHIVNVGAGIMFEGPNLPLNQKVWNIQSAASIPFLEFNTFNDDYSGVNSIFSMTRDGQFLLAGATGVVNAISGGLSLRQMGSEAISIFGSTATHAGTIRIIPIVPNSLRIGDAATIGNADGNAARLLLGDGVPANAALRIISELSSTISLDVVNGNSSATPRILTLQPNGGGIIFGGTIRPTATAGYHSQDNSAGLTSNVIIGTKILVIKDGIITGFS